MKTIILAIILICMCLFSMAGLVPFYYGRLRGLEPKYFKKVIISKKFSKLFVGYGGKDSIYGDVTKYGVILPIFILHILEYTLSILSFILTFILIFTFGIEISTTAIVVFAILFFEVIIMLVTDFCCFIISKRKNNKNLM